MLRRNAIGNGFANALPATLIARQENPVDNVGVEAAEWAVVDFASGSTLDVVELT